MGVEPQISRRPRFCSTCAQTRCAEHSINLNAELARKFTMTCTSRSFWCRQYRRPYVRLLQSNFLSALFVTQFVRTRLEYLYRIDGNSRPVSAQDKML
jgi:hypothetical protein